MGGNYRVVQEIKKQDPYIMEFIPEDDNSSLEDTNNILKIVLIFVCVNLVIELGLNYAIYQRKLQRAEELEEKKKRAMMGPDMEDGSIEYAPVIQSASTPSNKNSFKPIAPAPNNNK